MRKSGAGFVTIFALVATGLLESVLPPRGWRTHRVDHASVLNGSRYKMDILAWTLDNEP